MAKKADIPVAKNQTIEAEFEDVTHDGQGVAKADGYPLFVPGALPGERGTVRVLKTNKSYGYGKLLELAVESPDRRIPPCPVYHQCGGCQLQHMSYAAQLRMKEKHVRDCLQRIGKIAHADIRPIIGMGDPWRYRNKVQVPVGMKDGELVAGFYRERTHKIINMDRCLIQMEKTDEVVQKVKELCGNLQIPPYDEERHEGVLRHIMVRYGLATREIMVVLITRTDEIPNRKKLVRGIVEAFPDVKSIVQNINPKRTNVILGEETRVLWGRDVIYDKIGDIRFAISAQSFYQVNPVQTRVLYEKALEYAGLTGEETVIDAYCGIGTIALFLAGRAKKIYGVEVVPEAVADAKRNAELNGIRNAEFAVGKAETVMEQWYEAGLRPDCIVVDPPRKGCEPSLLETILKMSPQRVVYVSCNPATLARDLRILEDGGYRTEAVQPVDMFPQTKHVEAVVRMTLKEQEI
ncbi:23S rRNA (uracil(1939)-C(5))-methyltransferase RlmD [Caldibacillus debilis]|jgi:23S rRNA (uracil1939-C5)-methyltransferase|uniref:23S rRNA m(5)U-1939 methyltransferase n=1 Tax=Caldibacillus debilis GB1 TaxID=1339248 RepID=A0A420VCD0_9BACI|nr:23S rRNA (uracil(1939)-C(5))-methyltransferase RlmD [Caldibacillus debilis]RKO61271.1 23S rRNA m(5)U-1939 methyltransferase [Caldibacillus debilis GB1]